MSRHNFGACLITAAALVSAAFAVAAPAPAAPDKKADGEAEKSEGGKFEPFKPEAVTSTGSVTIGGWPSHTRRSPAPWSCTQRIGTTCRAIRRRRTPASAPRRAPSKNPNAVASMFYVAYFKKRRRLAARHIHLQRRTRLSQLLAAHGGFRSAPNRHGDGCDTRLRRLIPSSTTLRACSMQPISCSSTRPARASAASPARTRKRRSIGVDQDAYAFAEFISQFLSKYGRWNSPKYLFGESYGTPRSAVLINQLEAERSIDFNGVILLSQILNFDLSPDRPDRQSRHRSALPDRAADLCRNRLVPQQTARRAYGSRGAARRGRAIRHGRLCQGARRGL